MTKPNSTFYLIIRIMTCGIWVSVGLHQIFNTGMHIGGMEAHGITILPGILVFVFMALNIGGSIMVIMNKYVWLVCLAWMAFLVPASLLYHTGWISLFAAGETVGPPFGDMTGFFKNVSLFGGLMALLVLDQSKPAWLGKFVSSD